MVQVEAEEKPSSVFCGLNLQVSRADGALGGGRRTHLCSWLLTFRAPVTRLLWVLDRKSTRFRRQDPGPLRSGTRKAPELSVVIGFSHSFTSRPSSAAQRTHVAVNEALPSQP